MELPAAGGPADLATETGVAAGVGMAVMVVVVVVIVVEAVVGNGTAGSTGVGAVVCCDK